MKLEVGKQYRTRGGWRAIVVDMDVNRPQIWHSIDSLTRDHDADGYWSDNYSIEEEWKEPKTKTVYVHWWDGGELTWHEKPEREGCKAIAKVTLIKGQYDE